MAEAKVTLLGTFERMRPRDISSGIHDAMSRGLSELNTLRPDGYTISGVVTWFTLKIEVAQHKGTVSVFAMNKTRPVGYQLLTYTNEGEILLPGVKTQDFCRLVEILELEDLKDVVTLNSLIYKSYAVYDQQCPPVQIRSAEDARRLGFELDKAATACLTEPSTLWWQKWGGSLSGFYFDPVQCIVERKYLKSWVGDCKNLPIGLLR